MARGKNYVNNNRGLHLQSGKGGKKNTKMCEYGAGCTRADCIYRHDDNTASGSGNNQKNDGVCVLFLAGKCSFKGKGCRKRHPTPDEVKRLKARYQKMKCRHGDECFTDGCLFSHPRDVKDQDPVAFIEPHDFPPLNGGAGGPAIAAAAKPVPNSAWNSAPVGIHNQGDKTANGKYAAVSAARPAKTQRPEQSPTRNQTPVPGPPPPTPNSPVQLQQEEVNLEGGPPPPPPQQGWGGYNQGGGGSGPPQQQNQMMMPPMPAQQYYGGPSPQMIIDPNTGYPIDPAYFEQFQAMMYHAAGMQQQQQQYPPQPYGVPMGMPMEATHFNVEAKEFIPSSTG